MVGCIAWKQKAEQESAVYYSGKTSNHREALTTRHPGGSPASGPRGFPRETHTGYSTGHIDPDQGNNCLVTAEI